ncbi:MAG TPA: hypothetical protein PKA06_14080 [Gemmatales bacterium]|nr:hypothetical protein [Gemmatales bacterium]
MHRNLLLMMLFFALTTVSQADWPQFRGPTGNGVALERQVLPETWNAETNLSWKLVATDHVRKPGIRYNSYQREAHQTKRIHDGGD